MKIAISARGREPDSPLDPRFGRAAGFVLFDTDTGGYDYLDNGAQVDLPQGAGIQTAQAVADSGVGLLITGRVGPKAEAALAQAGVSVFFSERETVAQALQEYRQGGASAPNRPQGQASGCGVGGGRGMGGGGGRGMGGGGGRGMGGGGRGMGGGGGRGMGGGRRNG